EADIVDARAVVVGFFDGGTGADIAELEANGGAAARYLDVLEFQHAPEVAVFLKNIVPAQCLYVCHIISPLKDSTTRYRRSRHMDAARLFSAPQLDIQEIIRGKAVECQRNWSGK